VSAGLTLAVVLGGALAAGAARDARGHEQSRSAGTSAPAVQASPSTPTGVPDTASRTAVFAEAQRLLNVRAKAIMTHDRRAFMAGLLPGDAALRKEQDALWRSLSRLPVEEATITVDDESALSVPKAQRRYGSHAWVVAGRTGLDMNQYGESLHYVEPFTVVPHQGQWYIASDRLGLDQVRDKGDIVPWELGETWSTTGRSSLVIANAKERGQLKRLAARVDAAVDADTALWPESSNRVVVFASGEPAALRSMSGGDDSPPLALTLGRSGAADTHGSAVDVHVILNARSPQARTDIVLRHEVTHALLMTHEYAGTPAWIAEGVAEYTAYRTRTASQVMRERGLEMATGRALEARRFRISLPGSVHFYDGSDAAVSQHYTDSMLVCAYVAHRYGEKKLVRLHDELGLILNRRETARREPDTVRTVLGVSEAHLVDAAAQWTQQVFDDTYR